MSILCTVTTNLQAKNANGYAGVQKHTEHDPNINHSNRDINFNETQFNVYNESPNARKAVADWNNKRFGDYVHKHDEHQRSTGHSERCYGSVQGYLKDRRKATGVLTIGNMEVQTQLMEQFCPSTSYDVETLPDGTKRAKFKLYDDNNRIIDANIAVAKKFYQCFNNALIKATANNMGWTLKSGQRVNVGDYLHRGRYAVNNDEMGMSHIHYELATYGLTRGGKKSKPHATSSLNRAIVSLHQAVTGKSCSGRESIKWYRAQIDNLALKCLDRELHRTYNVPEHEKILEFTRKSESDPSTQTGLSMEQLKSQKQELAKHQQQVNALKTEANELTKKNKQSQNQINTAQQISNVAQDVRIDVNNAYTAITGQQVDDSKSILDVATAVKSASDSVKAEADNNKQLIKRQKQRISQQQQQIADQQRQLRDIQSQQKSLKKENEQLKNDNNALKEALETFKKRVKSAGLIIGQWFKDHWKLVEEPLHDYAHNINNADHERLYGGRDGTGDVYEARRFEKEAKSGLLSSLDAIELKTAKDLGLQQAFKTGNAKQADNENELSK